MNGERKLDLLDVVQLQIALEMAKNCYRLPVERNAPLSLRWRIWLFNTFGFGNLHRIIPEIARLRHEGRG